MFGEICASQPCSTSGPPPVWTYSSMAADTSLPISIDSVFTWPVRTRYWKIAALNTPSSFDPCTSPNMKSCASAASSPNGVRSRTGVSSAPSHHSGIA